MPGLQKIALKSLALSLTIFEDDQNLSWQFLNADNSLFLGISSIFVRFFTNFHPFLPICRNSRILKSEKQKKIDRRLEKCRKMFFFGTIFALARFCVFSSLIWRVQCQIIWQHCFSIRLPNLLFNRGE